MKRLLQKSNLEKINDSTNCLRTDCEVYRLSFFLECLSANKSLLEFLIYGCSTLDFHR